jgi:hypothetical protein
VKTPILAHTIAQLLQNVRTHQFFSLLCTSSSVCVELLDVVRCRAVCVATDAQRFVLLPEGAGNMAAAFKFPACLSVLMKSLSMSASSATLILHSQSSDL